MCTVHYTIFSVLKSNVFIRALLLDRILVTEKTTRTPRVHLVYLGKLKSSDTNISVIQSNTILAQVALIKLLGVIIDSKLKFERHIVYTIKLRSSIGGVFRHNVYFYGDVG